MYITSFKNDMLTARLTSELQYVLAIFKWMLQKYCACHENICVLFAGCTSLILTEHIAIPTTGSPGYDQHSCPASDISVPGCHLRPLSTVTTHHHLSMGDAVPESKGHVGRPNICVPLPMSAKNQVVQGDGTIWMIFIIGGIVPT